MKLDGLNDYDLTCLICGQRQELIMPEHPGQPAVVALKEHLLELHHLTLDHLDAASRIECWAYQYTLPDGRPFLLQVERRSGSANGR